MPAVWVSNDSMNAKGKDDSNKVLAELKTIRVNKCVKCFESIHLCANIGNRPSRPCIRIHSSYTPFSYTFSSDTQCQAGSSTYICCFLWSQFWLAYHCKFNARVLDMHVERTLQWRNAGKFPHCSQAPSTRPETPIPQESLKVISALSDTEQNGVLHQHSTVVGSLLLLQRNGINRNWTLTLIKVVTWPKNSQYSTTLC